MLKQAPAGFAALMLFFVPVFCSAALDSNAAIEPTVRAFFAYDPAMIAIARCESEFRQFNTDGTVLHGGNKHTMTGIFQIAHLHQEEALRHGMDIDTIAGNIAYAKLLYDEEG